MDNNKKIYWIGGSPCSGKSSVAELIATKYDFYYYKCDDFLEEYIKNGAKKEISIMQKFDSMDINETWLGRTIDEQVNDEIEFYLHSFDMIKEDISNLKSDKNILIEGAAILPHNILKENINIKDYICVVPTKKFQVEQYSKREWVKYYLAECNDKDKAFNNWMERDSRFAEIIKNKALENNIKIIIEDGSKTINDRYEEIVEYFSLEKLYNQITVNQ